MHKLSRSQIVIVAAVYAGLLVAWTHEISESPITSDALGTLIPAVNLSHHGSYSLERTHPLTPTMYREPVPVLATAAAVSVVDAALGRAELPAYFSGERARYLKLQNVVWLTLLCTAAFLATSYFTSSFRLSVAMAVMSYGVFLHPAVGAMAADSLYTEIGAAAFLLLGSWFYAMAVSRRQRWALVATGICFSLLTLTKALALYVFAGLLVTLICLRMLRRSSGGPRAAASEIGVLILSFGMVVAPWMYRNWLQFDSLAISERGGYVLYVRALYNEVDSIEYQGLYYVWAPRLIRPAAGRLLGFSADDLKRGGRLTRLNARPGSGFAAEDVAAERAGRPERATSVTATARAERVKLRKTLKAAGFGQRTNVAADNLLKDRAIQMMLDNPLKVFAGTLVVLWRGGLLLVPLVAWIMIHAWRKKRDDLLAFCIPAVGFLFLYAFFSIFEPRYGVPMTPLALLAAVAVAFDKNWFSAFSVRRQTLARTLPAPTDVADRGSAADRNQPAAHPEQVARSHCT